MSNPEERLVEINHLKKYFHVSNVLLHAVYDGSFYINKGETLGLVGESGCGKSTTGRTIIRLLEADSGEVNFHGENVLGFNKSQMKTFREHVQMVFQDPYSCLNPRLSVFELIAEPLTNMEEYRRDKKKLDARVRELMDVVGLSRRLINAYPHELDGGRRQRVGIARALSVKPEFIVPVSYTHLDVYKRQCGKCGGGIPVLYGPCAWNQGRNRAGRPHRRKHFPFLYREGIQRAGRVDTRLLRCRGRLPVMHRLNPAFLSLFHIKFKKFKKVLD